MVTNRSEQLTDQPPRSEGSGVPDGRTATATTSPVASPRRPATTRPPPPLSRRSHLAAGRFTNTNLPSPPYLSSLNWPTAFPNPCRPPVTVPSLARARAWPPATATTQHHHTRSSCGVAQSRRGGALCSAERWRWRMPSCAAACGLLQIPPRPPRHANPHGPTTQKGAPLSRRPNPHFSPIPKHPPPLRRTHARAASPLSAPPAARNSDAEPSLSLGLQQRWRALWRGGGGEGGGVEARRLFAG